MAATGAGPQQKISKKNEAPGNVHFYFRFWFLKVFFILIIWQKMQRLYLKHILYK